MVKLKTVVVVSTIATRKARTSIQRVTESFAGTAAWLQAQ